MNCPTCGHKLEVDLRETVKVRGKAYAVRDVRRLAKNKTGRYYLRLVPVVNLEPKK